jgi:hypothetical protein
MTTATTRPIWHAHDGALDSLVFDLVEWIGKEPRTYAQVMEAWRTSCPRLAVWEEAVDRGYLVRSHDDVGAICVRVTAAGRAFIRTDDGRQRTDKPGRLASVICPPSSD